MKLKQLNLQKESAALPSQLDFNHILTIRGSDYFAEQQNRYHSLSTGYDGEMKVLRYLQEYSPSHWIVLQNVWLRDFDRFECDLIILTNNQIYVLEVKTYQGVFLYENGRCFYNGMESTLNPFEQIRKNQIHLRKICQLFDPTIAVQAAVIFAGDDHEVKMNTNLDNIRVVTRNGIRNFILDIIKEEKRIGSKRFASKDMLRVFNAHEILNPFIPASLTYDEMKEIRPGIHCANCHSFEVEIAKFKVSCSCGLHESREEAIIRTICDYGVLNYEKHLSKKALLAFFHQQVSRTHLIKILQKHFTIRENSSYTTYRNKKLPYHKIRDSFNGIEPHYFYNRHQDSQNVGTEHAHRLHIPFMKTVEHKK